MKRKILLVEDQAILALATQKELARYDYEASYVTTGEKAVELVCHQNEPIDLILMDIDLGSGIDGTEAARQILEYNEIPVVFLSSHVESEIVKKTEKITSYGYVVKSSSITVLDASIKMAFKLFESKRVVNSHRKSLDQREKELSASQHIAQLGTWHLDIATNEVTSTDGLYELFGIDPSIGPLSYEEHAKFFTPESWALLSTTIGETLKTGEPYDLELERANGGEPVGWMWVRGEVVRDEAGEIIELWGVARDITEEKRTERALRESREKYKRLSDNSPFLLMETDVDTHEILSCNTAMARALDSTPEALEGKLLSDLLPEDVMKVRADYGLRAVEEQKTEIFEDRRGSEFYRNIMVPVLLNNRRLVQIITTTITDLRVAQKELQDSLTTLHNVTDNMFDMVSLTTKEGEILYASPSHERILGYKPEYLTGRNVIDFIHPDDLERTDISIENIPRSAWPIRLEVRYRTSDGSYIWIEVVGRAQWDDAGEIAAVVYSTRDVTERKESQTVLRDSEELFRTLSTNIKDGVFLHPLLPDNKPGSFVWVNDAACEILGYSDEEFKNMSPWEIASHTDEGSIPRVMADLADNGTAIFEAVQSAKDGTRIPVEVHANVIEFKGSPHIVSVVRDISERKQVENSLRESESRMRALGDNLPAGQVYQLRIESDGNARFTYVSSQVEQLHECTVEEAMNDSSILIDRIVEEDRPAYREAVRKSRENVSLFDQTLRIRRTSGEIRWHRMISRPRRLADGAVLFDGINMDITEHHQMEQDLRESEARFRTLHSASFGGIYIHDHGKIMDCNQRLSDITGYSRDELIGMDGLLLIAPDWREFVMAKIASRYEGPYEAEGLRKDGAPLSLWLQGKNIPYGGKEVRIAELRDISDLKEVQNNLEIALDEKQRLLSELNHRIKNSFNMIQSMIQLQAGDTPDGKDDSLVRTIMQRVATISDLYSMFSDTESITSVDLCVYCRSIVDSLKRAYSDTPGRIAIDFDCENINADMKSASNIGLCINEIITNSFKYAFPDRKEGEIGIGVKRIEDIVHIAVWDNGIGLPEGFDLHNSQGLGTTLVYGMVQQMGGEITVDTTRGTKYTITIPGIPVSPAS